MKIDEMSVGELNAFFVTILSSFYAKWEIPQNQIEEIVDSFPLSIRPEMYILFEEEKNSSQTNQAETRKERIDNLSEGLEKFDHLY